MRVRGPPLGASDVTFRAHRARVGPRWAARSPNALDAADDAGARHAYDACFGPATPTRAWVVAAVDADRRRGARRVQRHHLRVWARRGTHTMVGMDDDCACCCSRWRTSYSRRWPSATAPSTSARLVPRDEAIRDLAAAAGRQAPDRRRAGARADRARAARGGDRRPRRGRRRPSRRAQPHVRLYADGRGALALQPPRAFQGRRREPRAAAPRRRAERRGERRRRRRRPRGLGAARGVGGARAAAGVRVAVALPRRTRGLGAPEEDGYGARLKEGQAINKSLLALGNVISELSKGGAMAGHVQPPRLEAHASCRRGTRRQGHWWCLRSPFSPAPRNRDRDGRRCGTRTRAKRIVNRAPRNRSRRQGPLAARVDTRARSRLNARFERRAVSGPWAHRARRAAGRGGRGDDRPSARAAEAEAQQQLIVLELSRKPRRRRAGDKGRRRGRGGGGGRGGGRRRAQEIRSGA